MRSLLLICLFTSISTLAKPVRFDFRDPFQRNIIRVDNEGSLERTTGLLNALRGWIEIDPVNVTGGVKGEFQIDLRRMETAVTTKNDFVKEKLLQTAEFPMATLVIEKAAGAVVSKLKPLESTIIRLAGTLTVRNFTQKLEWNARFTYFPASDQTKTRMPGNLLRVAGQQEMELAPFGVSIPDALKHRFAPKIIVHADLLGSDLSTLDLSTLPSY